jgi:SAM-dependent methyltransferase
MVTLSYDPSSDLVYMTRRGYGGAIFVGDGRDDDLADYRAAFPAEAIAARRFYNIGAGSFRHPAWSNVDYPSEHYGGIIDIACNLETLDPLAIESGTAELVYTAHTLEHVSPAAGAHALTEAYRILKPGGVLRVVLPDADYYWSNYKARTQNFNLFANIKVQCLPFKVTDPAQADHEQAFIYEIAMTACDLMDVGAASTISTAEFRRAEASMPYETLCDWVVQHVDAGLHRDLRFVGYHRNWWNRVKARRELERAGFTRIWDSSFGQSSAPVLRNVRYFDLGSYYQDISLYIEAIK